MMVGVEMTTSLLKQIGKAEMFMTNNNNNNNNNNSSPQDDNSHTVKIAGYSVFIIA